MIEYQRMTQGPPGSPPTTSFQHEHPFSNALSKGLDCAPQNIPSDLKDIIMSTSFKREEGHGNASLCKMCELLSHCKGNEFILCSMGDKYRARNVADLTQIIKSL